jgi:hypothetical protein
MIDIRMLSIVGAVTLGLAACGESETRQTSSVEPARSVVSEEVPSRDFEKEHRAEMDATREANTRNQRALVAFATAMVVDVKGTLADLAKHAKFVGGYPGFQMITTLQDDLFGERIDPSGQQDILRAFMRSPMNMAILRSVVVPFGSIIQMDPEARAFLKAGEPVFGKALAPPPVDIVAWYDQYHLTRQSDGVPSFWKEAYGENTFSENAVWWYMFLLRRQTEGGMPVVAEWQKTLAAFSGEISTRPAIASGK